MFDPKPVDLTNCDREPIHVPGTIQPHGVLLACDINAAIVRRHSLNAMEMLGLKQSPNGMELDAVLGERATHDIRNALSALQEGARPALMFGATVRDKGAFDIAAHRYKGSVIIELEPSRSSRRALVSLRDLIERIKTIESVNQLINRSAAMMRALLGYDRVMIYAFEQDGSGKVVSEVKRADLESFLGQYFPATDIPQQARTLYLKNTIRIISDASGSRVPIEPVVDASGEPLDLSLAHLRSVSPIHCEYLRNMGVAASMSISIIIDGKLWGLIACHHYSPRNLPMGERVVAEMFGEFLSLHLQALRQTAQLESANRAHASLERFLRVASHHADVADLLRDHLADFASLVPCDGVGLWVNGQWTAIGSAPPAGLVPAIVAHAKAMDQGRVWVTSSLAGQMPDADRFADAASGVMAIPVSQIPRDYLFYFRKELVQTLNWAGNPEKSYETGPLGDRLTPRKSFAIWKETVHQQSQPWTEAERAIAEAARAAIVEVVLKHTELLADERQKADVRQRMLNEELNHRVKNILAVIKSLVGHPVEAGRSISDYVASLKGRIQALAFAHDQVIRGDGGGALADLIEAELTPYRNQGGTISTEGPRVWLDSRAFSVMALVLHELATNAAKYGALSRAGGALSIRWTCGSGGDCTIDWVESGGPAVSPPTRVGFGTALIDRSIPYDLGGESRVDYSTEGVRGHFVLPGRHVSLAREALAPAADVAAARPDPKSVSLSDVTVLLLEDQMLIAMDVEGMLEEGGVGTVMTTNSVEEALVKLRSAVPHVAVLDINLGTGTSIPVAEELSRRQIPFIFATGYRDSSMIPESLAAIPVVRKPYDARALLAAIQDRIGPELEMRTR